MAENYKHLYEQMKKMVELYQDEIVPQLREQFEQAKKPQWIKLSERLPTEEGFYRVCHKSKAIADRYFYGDGELFTKFGNDPVTHWKPIEEPPKGDE